MLLCFTKCTRVHFVGSILGIMHFSPLQVMFTKNFKLFTSLFCALIKGQGVDIIYTTCSRRRKVIWITNFNQISIREKEKNRR